LYRHVFGLESYALVQLTSVVVFAVLAVVLFRRSQIRLRHAAALTGLYVLCNFVAAKLLFDFVKAGGRHTLFHHPALAHFMEGGYWGWPIAFLPCVLAYPFALSVPKVPFFRAVAFILPPVFVVQKVACFLAGCCFGCETEMPWAVIFPNDSLCELSGKPIHPLQVYDAVLAAGILGVVVFLDRKGNEATRANLLPVMIGLYASARFATEFLRPHPDTEVISTSQWIELGAVVAVASLLLLGRGWWQRLVRGDLEVTEERRQG
jgi:prolipoprotein diacylglyceryltransferase